MICAVFLSGLPNQPHVASSRVAGANSQEARVQEYGPSRERVPSNANLELVSVGERRELAAFSPLPWPPQTLSLEPPTGAQGPVPPLRLPPVCTGPGLAQVS